MENDRLWKKSQSRLECVPEKKRQEGRGVIEDKKKRERSAKGAEEKRKKAK